MNLPDLTSNATSTPMAVVLGAVLAMVSGIVGNRLEAHSLRRERERSAALLFGEIFATVKIILEGAEGAVKVGEPFGSFTRRLLHAARREMDIYERNRESLVALREAKLRSDIHNVALRIAMPVDGLLESLTLGANIGTTDADRLRTFGFLMETVGRIPDLTRRLGRLANHDFADYGEAVPRAPAAVDEEAVVKDETAAARAAASAASP